MIDWAWVVAFALIGLGSLFFGIAIGKNIGYCERIIEEMNETLDEMEAR